MKVSHPSWVCGLKLVSSCGSTYLRKSHPSWVCGLKLTFVSLDNLQRLVTPFVGVWIETNW